MKCTYGKRPDVCACGDECQYLPAPPTRSPWRADDYNSGKADSPYAWSADTLPNGLPNAPHFGTNPKDLLGAKKVDLSLVPAIGIWHEACAFMDGAIEYGPYNWRDSSVQARVYIAAARRHIDDWEARLDYTGDTDVHSLGAARACLGILLDADMSGNLIDNRPPHAASAFKIMTEKLNAWAKARGAKGRYRNV